jgi:hypothetical protein
MSQPRLISRLRGGSQPARQNQHGRKSRDQINSLLRHSYLSGLSSATSPFYHFGMEMVIGSLGKRSRNVYAFN